jgi:hypothetical protein
MNVSKKVSIPLVSAVLVFIMVAAVMASSWTAYSPLYNLRMEQASAKMNFLPTAVNSFAYDTSKGFTLNHTVSGGQCEAVPLFTWAYTCNVEDETCGYYTCLNTCPATCPITCSTCPATCLSTCPATCSTCPATCPATCSTCDTCASTCPDTCKKTCICPEP